MEGRTVLLIRHGAVDLPAVGTGIPRNYGPHEPLSDRGIHQGILLAEQMKHQGIQPQLIISSLYTRAYQTADLLHKALPDHPPVIPDEKFNGARTPQWDHRPQSELGSVGGNYFADNPYLPDVHGETLPSAYTRVISEYKRILDSHKTETIAIVTHGEIIGMIMHYLTVGEYGAPGVDQTVDKGEALVLRVSSEGKLLDTRHIISAEGSIPHVERRGG